MPGAVAEDLELDVMGALQELLEVDRLVAERRRREPPRLRERGRQVLGAVDARHPLAAASGGGLDEHGEADADALRRRAPRRSAAFGSEPGTTGTPASRIFARDRTLSPICSIASGEGPTQTRPACVDRAGEVGVLREKTVSRVHAVGLRASARPR